MLVAGYCIALPTLNLIVGMYAASANLVLTTGKGNGVNGFTLDNALGEFILTHPNVSPCLKFTQFRCASPRNGQFIP